MTRWTRMVAVCAALALSAPAVTVLAQEAKGGKDTAKEEPKSYASAKEVMDSFKELTKDFGRNPSEEQIHTFFAEAFKRAADYISANPDAKDHDSLYRWAGPRSQYASNHEGYIRLADLYLKSNGEAKDAAEWRKWSLIAKLGHDKYSKEAADTLKKMEIEAKGDAAKTLAVGEIKLLDALNRKDEATVKAVTQALTTDKALAEAKEPGVYRDLMRVVLSAHKAAIKEGETFEDWGKVMTVKDLDGKAISTADYKGKIVLLDFWATWCGPCIKDMPEVIKLYEELHEQGFEIIGISFDNKDGEQALRDTIAGKGRSKLAAMPWRQIYDGGFWSSGMAKRYGINSIPRTVLLDAEGKVVADGLRGEKLSQKVRELVAALKPAETK